ncbi:AI-2E family transporter [Microcoleus vaginatus]|uniref:AI-2E family transporter n=1 Tax=Microcoleus vaginatus TaxID=119532 RepID=UPI0040409902
MGFFALQVTLLFVDGIVAFIFAFIPYNGEFLSVISARLLLLASPWKAGEVLLLYFLIPQIGAGCFVTPLLMNKQVYWLSNYTLALKTVFRFLLVFWGGFLTPPILIVIKTLVKELLIKDLLYCWQTAPSGKLCHSP